MANFFLPLLAGTTDFGPLTLRTRAPVLIPRPETAHITQLLADSILEEQSQPGHEGGLEVVDLCIGSGCIALLLGHLLGPRVKRIRGYDISSEAISLAKDNVRSHGMNNVQIKLGDIFDTTLVDEIGKVDLVVSNPPYIPSNQWEGLPSSVRNHEDKVALLGGGEKGLAFYERIAEMIPHLLKPNGKVAVEVGPGQAQDVAEILQRRGGLGRTDVWHDQFGRKRMVVGWQ